MRRLEGGTLTNLSVRCLELAVILLERKRLSEGTIQESRRGTFCVPFEPSPVLIKEARGKVNAIDREAQRT
jgi:hypothetical protein